MEQNRKIICLGFQKSGTNPVSLALQRLGYSVGFVGPLANAKVEWSRGDADSQLRDVVIQHAKTFDAIHDLPCAFLHRELDAAFPGSKFVLLRQDSGTWLTGYRKNFSNRHKNLRKWMYGVDRFSGNKDRFREVFESRITEITNYFSERPDDLLVLDVAKGDGWLKLVQFLGEDMQKPFPHANPAKTKWQKLFTKHRKKVITRFFYVITIIVLLGIWAYQ